MPLELGDRKVSQGWCCREVLAGSGRRKTFNSIVVSGATDIAVARSLGPSLPYQSSKPEADILIVKVAAGTRKLKRADLSAAPAAIQLSGRSSLQASIRNCFNTSLVSALRTVPISLAALGPIRTTISFGG